MNPMAMKDALKAKKGQGIDIKLIIGEGQDHETNEHEQQEADMFNKMMGKDDTTPDLKLESKKPSNEDQELAPEVNDKETNTIMGNDDVTMGMRTPLAKKAYAMHHAKHMKGK